jgi:hypothetical protein
LAFEQYKRTVIANIGARKPACLVASLLAASNKLFDHGLDMDEDTGGKTALLFLPFLYRQATFLSPCLTAGITGNCLQAGIYSLCAYSPMVAHNLILQLSFDCQDTQKTNVKDARDIPLS